MKLHASRYGLTTAMCVLAATSMVIAADNDIAKWFLAFTSAMFSGLFCIAVIPFEQKGDT